MKIRIGTRKSKLALIQTDMVIAALKNAFPQLETEIVPITTGGDRTLDKPLLAIGGKGVFVEEIEYALRHGDIDIAVHSGKDLPSELGEGLIISGVLERGNPSDVLMTRKGYSAADKTEFLIGTGSMRRRSFAKKHFPNAVFEDIRGNVDTRTEKLLRGDYDGIILAASGLERLGALHDERLDIIPFDTDSFLPAPCQGIIAVESRDDRAAECVRAVSHENTFCCFETERYVMKLLNASCTMPLGAFARINGDRIILSVSADGDKILRGESAVSDRLGLAERLVKML
ncbi:MAG: hydroxymethylbilane synthase [Huintestinicola sp.]